MWTSVNQAVGVNQSGGLVIIPLLLRGVVISAINTNINVLRYRGRGGKKQMGEITNRHVNSL